MMLGGGALSDRLTPWRRSGWIPQSAAIVSVVALLVVLAEFVLPTRVPLGELLYGAMVGSVYSLEAVALILVYRSNRIINFALAEIGTLGAVLYECLQGIERWPWWSAALTGIAATVACGFVLERFVARRFSNASRLIFSVATLGMAQLAAAGELGIANVLHGGIAQSGLTTPFSSIHFSIGGTQIDGNAIALLLLVPVVLAGLEFFLHRSDYGVALRASAESGERASLLGVPVATVSTISWVIAAGIVGVVTVLRTPVTGVVAAGGVVGPSLLLRGLTVAVIARFSNLRVAVMSGLFLGALQGALDYAYAGSTVTDPVFVGILIVAALALYRPGTTRTDNTASSWNAIEVIRQIPHRFRSRPSVRIVRWGTAGAVLVVALMLPYLLSPAQQFLTSTIVIDAIVAVSLVVVTGWSGQISLGQMGIAALGAAVSGRLTADAHWDFFVSFLVAGAAGAVMSMLLGVAATRVRGFLFAVTSLGFAIAIESYFLNARFFPYLLPVNRPGRPMLFGHIDLSGDRAFYFFCLLVLVAIGSAVTLLRRTRTGRVLTAVRDNDRAAQSYGVSRVKSLLTAFAVSGFIAGIAGSLLAAHDHAVSPSAFPPSASILVFAMAAIGGLGSVGGAVAGTALVMIAVDNLPAGLSEAATGIGLLIVLLILPGGIASLYYRARDRFLGERVMGTAVRADTAIDDLPGQALVATDPAAVAPAGEPDSVAVS